MKSQKFLRLLLVPATKLAQISPPHCKIEVIIEQNSQISTRQQVQSDPAFVLVLDDLLAAFTKHGNNFSVVFP